MNYTILKRIGIGSYGTVFLIRSTITNNFYALKKIYIDELYHKGDMRRQLHEINILFFNKCPYLLSGIDIQITNKNILEIITPYYDGGNLENYITTNRALNKYIKISTVWDFFIQLCYGIKYLHDNNIMHKDLKPANILLDDKIKPTKVIIIDFGVSIINKQNDNLANTIIGTPYFMCPELCENKKYSNKCDVWALGCILYELVTLEKPFQAQNIQLLNYKISVGKYKEITNPLLDHDINIFKKIIRMCLNKNSTQRATIYDILNLPDIYYKILKYKIPTNPLQLQLPIIIKNDVITKNELFNFVFSLQKYIKKDIPIETNNIIVSNNIIANNNLISNNLMNKYTKLPPIENNKILLEKNVNIIEKNVNILENNVNILENNKNILDYKDIRL